MALLVPNAAPVRVKAASLVIVVEPTVKAAWAAFGTNRAIKAIIANPNCNLILIIFLFRLYQTY
jgi:aspartate-semialdehyde dehydrogenase